MPNASLGGAMYFLRLLMMQLKCLRTNNGGEFMSYDFTSLCVEKGIRCELSAPYTPPQNGGVLERMNMTIQEKVQSMLSMVGLSDAFWDEAIITAVHLINRALNVPLGFKVPKEPIDPQVGDHSLLGNHADVGQPDAPPPQVLRCLERCARPPQQYVPSMDYVMLTNCGEPSCYDEAMFNADKLKWQHAMQSEMGSLIQNDTWELTPLPKVVVKMTTLHTLFALVATKDMELKQLDVKTTFLHGNLHEDLYMDQPTELVAHASKKLVCWLWKILYGLKQAPREWYQKFDAFMRSEGYVRNHEDPCLYTCKTATGSLTVLVLYVDDMLVARKSAVDVDALKHRLHETFAMKDLRDASHILGMWITRDCSRRLLFLSQKEYIDRVLERFHMEGGKAISTTLPPYAKLTHGDCPQMDVETAKMSRIPYASAIGSLMYALNWV
ncbi:hypothetical protein L7F22_028884 [Adiantum nelumboides]|nr:hypothetical protein [Adiantum nelumboides]